jgi:hypothetical protein
MASLRAQQNRHSQGGVQHAQMHPRALHAAAATHGCQLSCRTDRVRTYKQQRVDLKDIGCFVVFCWASCRFDPAITAVPLMTTCVDSTGLVIYFYIAQLVLGIKRH